MQGLEKLNEIVANRQEFQLTKLDSDGNEIIVLCRMNVAADENQIEVLNDSIETRLPTQLREFLTQYNGARLYDYEGIDGFQLLSCDEVISANNLAKSTFEEDWNNNLLIFAKHIGENNYLAFDTSNKEEKVIDCYFEEMPSDWNTIACDLDEFLQLLIQSEGSKYWLKE